MWAGEKVSYKIKTEKKIKKVSISNKKINNIIIMKIHTSMYANRKERKTV